jgi:hypothetical protein
LPSSKLEFTQREQDIGTIKGLCAFEQLLNNSIQELQDTINDLTHKNENENVDGPGE